MTRASQLAAIGKADAAYAEAWSTLYTEACLEWEVLARPDAQWTKANYIDTLRLAFQDAALSGQSPAACRTAAKLAVGSW